MAIEYKKMFSASWKRAATLSGTWGAVVGAFSLIMNALPDLIFILLAILVPISLLVPAIIGFVTTKNYAASSKIELKPAVANGAISGIIYAVVMISIALFFILVNYAAIALFWGLESLVEGLIAMLATLVIGLPVMVIIGIISGAIGGAVYSSTKK